MANISFYRNYVSTHYGNLAPDRVASFQKRYFVWRSYLFRFLPHNKKATILEIGCGLGHNLTALRKLGYTELIGTDFSKECVEACTQLGFRAEQVNSTTEASFYRSMKREVDAVILYDVIEHYTPSSAIQLLSKLRSVLKQNGSILISTPNADHPLSNSLRFADITHEWVYNTLSLSQMFRNAGFTKFSFFQMHSITPWDDNVVKRMIKTWVALPIAWVGEQCIRLFAATQGILMSECKPTLIACVDI